MYVTATAMLIVGTVALALIPFLPPLRAFGSVALTCAASWLVGSLLVSYYVYDVWPLYRGEWIEPALGISPRRYASFHVGFDEFSNQLATLFTDSIASTFDIYDAQEITEPSIRRARMQNTNQPPATPADFRSLPLRDDELDAAFVIFAAHEFRSGDSRLKLFRELGRVLKPNGRILLVEHLRDFANFIPFGPGFLHFHSRSEWLRGITSAGLAITGETRLTPFVRAFRIQKAPATPRSRSA
jgi:SAM-dependent methyltransferase